MKQKVYTFILWVIAIALLLVLIYQISLSIRLRQHIAFVTDNVWEKRSIGLNSTHRYSFDPDILNLIELAPNKLVISFTFVRKYTEYDFSSLIRYWYYPDKRIGFKRGDGDIIAIIGNKDKDYPKGYRLIYENSQGDTLFILHDLYNTAFREGGAVKDWLGIVEESIVGEGE